jgi:heavy metal translocating P-type ATPase
MFPLIPILLTGVGVIGGLKAAQSSKLKKRVTGIFKKVDHRYQQFWQQRIDPLFGTKQRYQQVQEFSSDYNVKEINVNRRLGLSVVNTSIATLSAVFYPPLLLVSALGLLYIMGPLMYESLLTFILEKRFKYYLFASLSVIAGLLGGFYVISSLMSVLVFIAFKIAARTEAYSHAALMNAFSQQAPTSVWVLANEVETEIAFSQLQVGDVIILSAGQAVPIDGHVVEGISMIDQHILTGESQPVEKTVNDQVFANTLVLTGKLYVRVEQTGTDTVAAQIGTLLNNAANCRLDHEARSEQLADKLTLPALAASGLALVTVGSSGAIAILNSGFGSTMVFSGPLSMLSYLNLASHNGILVKDGRSLEILHTIDTIVFDKTGTLTLEQPEVGKIHCCAGWTETQILHYAATAEHRQTHPIAKAILAAAQQRELVYTPPDSADYEIGFGIRVRYQGQTVQVGSKRFMEQAQIEIPAAILAEQNHCQQIGNSLVMVAAENQLIGAIELQAQLRPDTTMLVKKLHQRGLKLYILSGDHHQPTEHLARRLNIDDFFAEVLPEGKADMIKQLQQQGRKVCFVGDGINDAIALKQADVSVSLRGATTIATDSAQIVLVSDSLQQLAQSQIIALTVVMSRLLTQFAHYRWQ